MYEHLILKNNVVPDPHIKEILALTRQRPELALVGAADAQETNMEIRKTYGFDVPPEYQVLLRGAVLHCYKQVIEPAYKCRFKEMEPVQLLGYPVGGYYQEHNDSEYFQDGEWVRVAPRDISLIFYLNDDFEGGQLELTTLGLTIRPRRGMMVAFPSCHRFFHQVHPVTSGTRYTLVTWIETHERLVL